MEQQQTNEIELTEEQRWKNLMDGYLEEGKKILLERNEARALLLTALGLLQEYVEYSSKNLAPPLKLDLQCKKFMTQITKKL